VEEEVMRRSSVKSYSQAFTIVLLHFCFPLEWKGGHAVLREAKLCWAKACGGRGEIQGAVGVDTPHSEYHTVKEELTATN